MLMNTSIFLYLSLILTLNTCLCERSRPQTPKRPFKYIEKDVEFRNNEANVTLSGSLTYPRYCKPIGAVILTHGSGGHDRDQTIFGHKTFLVVADYLTKYGLAVLRYDERGIGKSTGNFTQADDIDIAKDAISGVKFLRHQKYLGLNNKKIGIVGFSKGCLTAIIAANRSKDIGFVVNLGFPVLTGAEILLLQQRRIGELSNLSSRALDRNENLRKKLLELILVEPDENKLNKMFTDYVDSLAKNETTEDAGFYESFKREISVTIRQFTTPWFKNFLRFNATEYLLHFRIPLLGLWGSKDSQVPAQENMIPAQKALELSGNKNYQLIEIKGANHFFQNGITGHPSEYDQIEQTISSEVLKVIGDWIYNLVL